MGRILGMGVSFGRRGITYLSALFLCLSVAGCTAVSFKSVWRAPNEPSWVVSGKKIAALVMTEIEAVRRNAEDLIAEELNLQGAMGHSAYRVLKEDSLVEPQGVLAALKSYGMEGVLVVRAFKPDAEGRRRSGLTIGVGYGRVRTWYGGMYDGWNWPDEEPIVLETRFHDAGDGRILWTGVTELSHSSIDEKTYSSVAKASLARMLEEGVLAR
jgi:hypothetical protein